MTGVINALGMHFLEAFSSIDPTSDSSKLASSGGITSEYFIGIPELFKDNVRTASGMKISATTLTLSQALPITYYVATDILCRH